MKMRNKRILATMTALTIAFGISGCGKKPVKEEFKGEYEIKGTSSQGAPKNDTYVFEGVTTDGIITELNFDIIRNKGKENEGSKKDMMGYLMNTSDAKIEKVDGNYKLTKLTANGFDTAYGDDRNAQYMVQASIDNITDTTTFKDLTFLNGGAAMAGQVVPEPFDKALIAFQKLAVEA
ncbi:MAG: hypothetical protein ACRC2K_11545, partial [Clostridium sp.]